MTEKRTKLGMVMFLVSEGIFFLLLILAYVAYHREHGNGPSAARSLDPVKTGIYSALLLASSLTMAWATRGAAAGRRGITVAGLVLTLLLGSTFLGGQSLEYHSLLKADVTISRDLFTTSFFTLTGFHGFHVLVGLSMIAILIGLGARRRAAVSGAAEVISLYWHFVDGVWVVIFAVVYLWAFL